MHRIVIVLAAALMAAAAWAQPFTYQGQLRENGSPANGSYNFEFKLFGSPAGNDQIGSTVTVNGQTVSLGQFTTLLDFGPQFSGADRWLEIAVDGSTLTPRTKLTAAPYALFAQGAPWSGIIGAPSSFPPSGAAGGDLTGTYPNPTIANLAVSDSKISDVAWSKITGVPSGAGAWSTTGNNIFNNNVGNVGIGTAAPSQKFSVYGGQFVLQTNDNSLPQSLLFQNSGANYTWRMYRSDAGSNAADLRFAGGLSTDFTLLPDILTLTNGGNVGIGTTAPAAKLEVAGTARMTGFQLGTSATSGHVLTTNASGVGSWQPLPAATTYWQPNGSNIYYDGGYVGVRTDQPQGALHVETGNAGTTTEDQSQTQTISAVGAIEIWQSFTAGINGLLTKVEFLHAFPGNSAFVHMRIYQGEGTGGQELFWGAYNFSGLSNTWKTLDIPAASQVSVAAGSVYTCRLTVTVGTSIGLVTGSGYAGGRASFNPDVDLVFKTHVTNGYVSPGHLIVSDGVTRVSAFQLGTSATAGHVLTADANGNGTWQAFPNFIMSGSAAGGDLTGTYPNPAIAANTVGSSKLASDGGSLTKVSGGAMVNSGGNIGIGTGSPAHRLVVIGDALVQGTQGYDASGETARLNLGDTNASIRAVFASGLRLSAFGAQDGLVLLESSGNVGIGTTSPTTKLDVNGTAKMAGFQLGTSATPGHVLTVNADGVGTWQAPASLYWQANGSNIYYNSGRVGIGTSAPLGPLHVATPASSGAEYIDQVQSTANTAHTLTDHWQSFTAGWTGSLTKVEIDSNGNSGIINATLRIYQGEGTGGALLYTGNYSINTGSPLNDWQAFVIPIGSAPSVTNGSVYTFRYTGDSFGVVTHSGNPYAGGRSSINATVDLTFRTSVVPVFPAGYFTVREYGRAEMSGFRLGASATTGQVLTADASGVGTWQSLVAGAGLTLSGLQYAIANNGVVNTMLASDGASLNKVSAGLMSVSSGRIGVGTGSPSGHFHAVSSVSDRTAVRGESTATTGFVGYGGYFSTASQDSPALVGTNSVASATSAFSWGVYGFSSSSAGRGVYGYAAAGAGANYGVYGRSDSATGYGVWAQGRFAASGTKAFVIDHPLDPENRYLMHYCTEGAEPLNAYSGNVVTDENGEAWVILPDYFDSINRDFRYQLTCMGQFAQAIVGTEIQNNRFLIRTNVPNVKVSWRVEATRNDRYMQHNGAPVEVNKPARAVGAYLQPELWNQPPERGEGYRPPATDR